MNKTTRLGAAAVAVALLAGASAFADQRPQRGTRGDGGRIQRGDRGTAPRSRVEVRGERPTRSRESGAFDRRSDRSTERRRSQGTVERRNESRGRNRENRGSYETFDQRRYTRGRESGERRRYDHNRSQHYRGRPFYHHGPVSRYERWGGGYRVWVGGARYPFFVPLAYWDPWRFRVGISIGLGGYYNSLGYYDYYDGYNRGYRDGYYRGDRRVYRTETLSGTVEDYDPRRRTALIRDDVTDRLVTVYMRTRDARLNHIRPGDFIEIEGGWRDGVFEAYRLFDVD